MLVAFSPGIELFFCGQARRQRQVDPEQSPPQLALSS
jgi:hypothetical protein